MGNIIRRNEFLSDVCYYTMFPVPNGRSVYFLSGQSIGEVRGKVQEMRRLRPWKHRRNTMTKERQHVPHRRTLR